jgi:hydrophobic/amphiphilic exporter-1 (mainly G- bacteria), HAE1 family
MSLQSLAVRRRVTFLMLFIVVLGFGLFSLARLKLDLWPDITFPYVVVITQYTGASPEDIEQLVTRPVEEASAAVEGVKDVTSQSKLGASVVFVEFEWGTDIDQAENDIRKNLDLYKDLMPTDANAPLTFAFDPAMEPVVMYAVTGPYDQAKLRDVSTHDIEPLLERIEGVAAADTEGGLAREIQVRIMPDRLAAAGVSTQQLLMALRRENMQVPAGYLTSGAQELTIQTHGAFVSVDEIREVVVGVAGGVPMRLKDVAEVVDTVHEQTRVIKVDGRDAVMLLLRKQSGANTVQTVNNVYRAMPDIMKALPKGVKLQELYSQAEFVKQALGNLNTSALLAVGITMIVLFLFLRSLWASIIVGVSIPASVVVSFAVMDQVGLTLNILSMTGLALAVGMLVDNSIVVLEAIYRHLGMGKKPARAAIDGTTEVGTAISASTLTTVVVFAPVLFVPGLSGAMFRDMAATICISLTASLVVALTIIPLGVSMFVRKVPDLGKGLLARSYVSLQGVTLKYRKLTVLAAILLLALGVFFVVRAGQDMFPKNDHGMIAMQIKGQVGSSLGVMDEVRKKAEAVVRKEVPEATVTMSQFGTAEGFMALFSEGSHSGMMRIKLPPRSQRQRGQQEIQEPLRKALNEIPGVEAKVMDMGFSGESDVSIEIFGYDLKEARRVGLDIKKLVQKIDDARDVTFSLEEAKPELHVIYDRIRLSRLGLTTSDVSASLSAFFQGTIATVYREGGNDYDILIRSPRAFREGEANLENMVETSPIAGSFPLRSVARIEEESGPVQITRKDQERYVTVSATSVGNDLGGLTAKIEKVLEKYPWPEEFRYHVGGAAEDFQEALVYLGIALIAALLLVYMVMAGQFESFLTPFIIFLTVPFSLIGVGLALFATHIPLSVTGIIGEVILIGVVVNNSIVLVDYANQLVEEGMDRVDAIRVAGQVRLRPILMTAMTTILGMLPMALEIGEGAESWSPLARVVIGGMVVCTFITLTVVPNLYIWMTKWRKAVSQKVDLS